MPSVKRLIVNWVRERLGELEIELIGWRQL
jgi:hypothetical protein